MEENDIKLSQEEKEFLLLLLIKEQNLNKQARDYFHRIRHNDFELKEINRKKILIVDLMAKFSGN